MLIIIARWTTENPKNSHNCWFTTIWQILNIWKRFAGQEILSCFSELSQTSITAMTLTLVENEVRRDKMPRAIIQSSRAGIESAPMMKVPADLKLEAFLCNYCCYDELDSDYLPTISWLATENFVFYPLRLPLWIFCSIFHHKILFYYHNFLHQTFYFPFLWCTDFC